MPGQSATSSVTDTNRLPAGLLKGNRLWVGSLKRGQSRFAVKFDHASEGRHSNDSCGVKDGGLFDSRIVARSAPPQKRVLGGKISCLVGHARVLERVLP